MRKVATLFALLLGIALAGCALPVPPALSTIVAAPATPAPPGISLPAPSETAPATDTPSAPVNCAYAWSNRELPEVSQELAQAFQEAGMIEVDPIALAFGENCIDTETNQVSAFLAMQTDFHLNVAVEDINDTEAMGQWIEKILRLLDEFPPGKVPGPNPGFVGIAFENGSQAVNLWFDRTKGKEQVERGLRGAQLFAALNGP